MFAACVYGSGVFRANNYYFWITIVGPIIGAIIGVWAFEGYLLLMKRYANMPGTIHIDAVEQPTADEVKLFQVQTQTSYDRKYVIFF